MSEQSGDSGELPEWAVKQAAEMWNWGCDCDECIEGSQKAVARALVETREKALPGHVVENAQRMALLVATLQIQGRLSITERDAANEMLKIHNDWYREQVGEE